MDQKGSFWAEAILTLAVIVVVFGTLLPLATKVTSTLYDKKLAMHAADTAYHGMILYESTNRIEGTRRIDGNDFNWVIDGQGICVFYETTYKETSKCVNY